MDAEETVNLCVKPGVSPLLKHLIESVICSEAETRYMNVLYS